MNRCGRSLTVPDTSSLLVSVRTELDPQGILRVRSVQTDVEGTPVPRSVTCISRAVESLAGPTFRGEAVEHVYTMLLARPLAGF